MKPSTTYIVITAGTFIALAAIFLLFPRSRYSELEKRDLAEFPEFDPSRLKGAEYTSALSTWFSDTEPFRDRFMAASMTVRDKLRYSFRPDEETVTFRSTDTPAMADLHGAGSMGDPDEEAVDNPLADGTSKIGASGIIIVGKAPNARALSAFGGKSNGGVSFAEAVNEYASSLPGVKVYAMVVPLASEFYLPNSAKGRSNPQLPMIQNIYSHLGGNARGVDAHKALNAHLDEDIYLRTDHHWAPLGAYYGARAFASTAGVPFPDLSSYEERTVKNFVGTMYGYSKDIAVKQSPEDFVYYLPKGINYTTEYRDYTLNKDYQVVAESRPAKGPFFYHYKDGSGGAYSTFMGGDKRLTKVTTGTHNGRRLVVVKDSYGNAVPGYLFHSFEEIHVVDFRYFTHNMKRYVADNRITDLLFCVNVFNAYSSSVAGKIKKLLTQSDNNFAAPTPVAPADSGAGARPTVSSSPTHPAPVETPAKSEPQPAETPAEPATPQQVEPQQAPAESIADPAE